MDPSVVTHVPTQDDSECHSERMDPSVSPLDDKESLQDDKQLRNMSS